MAREDAKRLLQDILADETKLAQLQEKSLGEAAEVARSLGYDVTEEEVAAELEEYRSIQAEQPVELIEDELDKVAGGIFGEGEIAPDGHEMGCILSWHGKSWARDNREWCDHNYFCYSRWDECVEIGRTNTSM